MLMLPKMPEIASVRGIPFGAAAAAVAMMAKTMAVRDWSSLVRTRLVGRSVSVRVCVWCKDDPRSAAKG